MQGNEILLRRNAIKISIVAATISDILLEVMETMAYIWSLSNAFAKCRLTAFISKNLSFMFLCFCLFYFLNLFLAPTSIFDLGFLVYWVGNAWNAMNLCRSCSMNGAFPQCTTPSENTCSAQVRHVRWSSSIHIYEPGWSHCQVL